jgi:16S rRNA (cytidine1402-2'-O)-methyltransferase
MNQGNHPSAASKPALKPAPQSAPGLYLVPTPIGNLRDITLRALDVLHAADAIACEDTRVTAKLLAAHGIATPLTLYHEHNAARARPKLLERLAAGEVIALVSDAGMPLISDPGYKLVREAVGQGIAVTALPGPSAALTGLLAAALPTDRFLFAGFPPNRAGARDTFFAELAAIPASLIFFESPKRLAQSLAAMAEAFGPREAAFARELTKRFEETRRGRLDDLAAQYAQGPAPKGEVVVIVGPPEARAAASAEAVDAALREALQHDGTKAAADAVADALGLKRRDAYRRALELKNDDGSTG